MPLSLSDLLTAPNLAFGAAPPASFKTGSFWYNTVTDILFVRVDDGVNQFWLDVSTTGGASSSPPKVTRFLASGTWTPSEGCRYAIAEVQAAGGGGGGVAAAVSPNVSLAGGGSAGAYAKVLLKDFSGPSFAVTVGAAGAAGLAGNNAGSDGGLSSVVGVNVNVSCAGGTGGAGGASASSSQRFNVTGGAPTVSGSSVVALHLLPGGESGTSIGFSNSVVAIGASGGDSFLGRAGPALFTVQGNGGPGRSPVGFGSGGGGAACAGNSVAYAGASGQPGIVVITEYF